MAPHPSSLHRPTLRPGSLQRLLRPHDPSDDTDDAPTPRPSSRSRPHGRVLLQVTNITPALSGADPFSGHQGFYLRLSDSSRSCYVSLHADHDDLILANGLHIGQVIEVDDLVPSVPVPVLRSFRVLPGRYPCIQLQDSTDDDVDATTCSARAEVKDKEVVSERPCRPSPTPPLPERKARQSGSPAAMGHSHRSRSITNLSDACAGAAASPVKRSEGERRGLDFLKKVRKISVASIDGNSSDVDDDDDESSSLSYARRNWDFSGNLKDMTPVAPRRRNSNVWPGKSGPNSTAHQSGPANDPLESVRRKAEKAFKVLSKRSTHGSSKSKTPRESSSPVSTPQSAATSGIRWCEDNVLWTSLSPSLVKHGKEAVKQRDMSLQAVLDGLLEASTTEKLIKCLITYSELQSDKDDDPKELIDRFLRFSQELDHAIFVAQSQTRLRQSQSCAPNSTSSSSAKAAIKAALDRKQSAISWVRAAIEADLSPLSSNTKATSESAKASLSESKPVTPRFCCSKTKCSCNGKASTRKAADACAEGSSLSAAMELAITLRSECTRWFLGYVDKFLDDIESEARYVACDSQVGVLLQQLKRVDDWLNLVLRHERMLPVERSGRDAVLSEEEENDACERVRRKIYGALLRHVQYAAMALESMNSTVTEEEN